MRPMKMMIGLVALLATGLSGKASAELFDELIGPDEIGPVSVAMNDNASGACWTNLREVREYTEEKLRIAGYEVGPDNMAMVDYTMTISVDGFRSKAVPICVGSIIVMLTRAAEVEGLLGLHTVAMENVVVTTPKNGNLNQRVIEAVQVMFDDL